MLKLITCARGAGPKTVESAEYSEWTSEIVGHSVNNGNSLVWIESTGGPLILLEEDVVPFWRGYLQNPSGMTDYERACEVSDYLGTIDVASRRCVVLGEQPYSTTWWQSDASDSGLLVRWVCAENEETVIQSLSELSDGAWQKTNVEIEVITGRFFLFDSASPGQNIDTSILIQLPKGRYVAETLHYDPNEITSLILHRFLPI